MSVVDKIQGVVSRTSVANVVAGLVLVMAAAYGVVSGNTQLVRDLALISAGYLFGKVARG